MKLAALAALAATLTLSACGSSTPSSPSPEAVASHLNTMVGHSLTNDSATCVHQQGNVFICNARVYGTTETFSVTDDGTRIAEQVIGATP